MIIKSNLKPRDYTEKEAVRIYNRDQQTFYIDSNVYPVDVYTSYSPKCERKNYNNDFHKRGYKRSL